MVATRWTAILLGTALAVTCLPGALRAADPAAPRPVPLDRATVTSARVALAMNIAELNVDNVPLGKVLDYLRDLSGANFVVNWKILEALNVAKDTPITLALADVPLRKALRLLLDQASPNAVLVFNTDMNVITITSQEEADKVMVTKVYVVDDLVMATRQPGPPPAFNLAAVTTGGSTTGGSTSGSSGGSGSLFSQTNSTATATEDTPQKRGDDLVKLITEIVRPNIWRDNGGTASIKYFPGKLIVTAPVSVQEAIGGPYAPEGGQRLGGF